MKKELLNEVSRIKNMMKQLNENDFTKDNDEMESNDMEDGNRIPKYIWNDRKSQRANSYRQDIHDSLRDLLVDDDVSDILFDFDSKNGEEVIYIVYDVPTKIIDNLSKEERQEWIRDNEEAAESIITRAERGNGPWGLELVYAQPKSITFRYKGNNIE
jgi:hypothetical protein